MTVLFRCRVDPIALKKADAVAVALGTKTPEVVRMVISEIGRTGRLPLKLSVEMEDELINKAARNKTLLSLDDTQDW